MTLVYLLRSIATPNSPGCGRPLHFRNLHLKTFPQIGHMTMFQDCLKNVFIDPHLAFSIDYYPHPLGCGRPCHFRNLLFKIFPQIGYMTMFRDFKKKSFYYPHLAFSINCHAQLTWVWSTIIFSVSTLLDLSIDWSHDYVSRLFKKSIR